MPFTPTEYLPYDFANRRHIGPSPAEMHEMFKVLSVTSLEALIDQTVPKSIRQAKPLDFGKPLSEREMLHRMRITAGKNKVLRSLIGQGYHGTVTPPAIQRNILENPAWYTAYTPYQPEISQGRLEALLNFQTMVTDLTGLDVANASLLDEATACAEAMTMAQRVAKSKAKAFFVDRDCHPQNIAVVKTRAEPLGIEVIVGNPDKMNASEVFGALFQYPGTYGHVRDFTAILQHSMSIRRSVLWLRTRSRSRCSKSQVRWAQILPWATRSASVFRWVMADRTRLIWHVKTPISALCQGGLSVCLWTVTATALIASACKPASNISAARKPRATSVQLRLCWL